MWGRFFGRRWLFRNIGVVELIGLEAFYGLHKGLGSEFVGIVRVVNIQHGHILPPEAKEMSTTSPQPPFTNGGEGENPPCEQFAA